MADDPAAPDEVSDSRTLEQRIMHLEIACDHLRYAVRRSTDLAMSVAQLVNVRDQPSADLIFRDMKLAISEINALAPIDKPLFIDKKAKE